jgi:hypothetical protein
MSKLNADLRGALLVNEVDDALPGFGVLWSIQARTPRRDARIA